MQNQVKQNEWTLKSLHSERKLTQQVEIRVGLWQGQLVPSSLGNMSGKRRKLPMQPSSSTVQKIFVFSAPNAACLDNITIGSICSFHIVFW